MFIDTNICNCGDKTTKQKITYLFSHDSNKDSFSKHIAALSKSVDLSTCS